MKIAFDVKLMRPGCVLLQGSLGCNPLIAHEFSTKDWLLAPTPDLGVYDVTPEQLKILVKKVGNKSLEK